jgi:hypothetical protein
MAESKIAVPGEVFLTELKTTQVPVALGASGAFAVSGNIATITFTAAHGLTFTPAAGTAANFFGTFTGVTGQTGIGTLNGPIFRLLAIPSTTTIQIYTTITAATMTGASFVPVFIPTGAISVNSAFAGGPILSTNPTVLTPGLFQASADINYLMGANANVQYNPDNTSIIQDATTLNAGSTTPGQTIATSPTFRVCGAVSTGGQIWFDGVGQTIIYAGGSAGTSYWSVIE